MGQAGHIRSLDTLRGLAALAVALFHARLVFGHAELVPHAYLCVDLFFVLSGFVLEHRYGRELRAGLSVPAFMRVRFARLYPLYLAATLAGVAWTLAVDTELRPEFVRVLGAAAANVALFPVPPGLDFQPAHPLFAFVSPAWSILWEIVLSAGFAVWMRRGGGGLGGIALSALAVCVVVAWRGHSLDYGWMREGGWVGGVRALLGFALGVGCRRAFVAVEAAGDRWLRLGLIVAGLAAGAAAADYVLFQPATNAAVELLCMAVLFPLLVCGVALAEHGLLANRLGDLLGGASYSIYLLHGLVIDGVATALKRLVRNHPIAHLDVVTAVAIFVVLLPLSWATWRGFERPAQKWLLQRARPAPARLAVPSAG